MSSGNRDSIRMSYINTSAVFATTDYLGYQEKTGTENKLQKTYDLLESQSKRLHFKAGYLRMLLCLLQWHVTNDNTYVCNELNQQKEVNLRHKEVTSPHSPFTVLDLFLYTDIIM